MNLQTIKSINGRLEYILLPVMVYRSMQTQIDRQVKKVEQVSKEDDYIPFDPADYVDNPVALARISAHMRQTELAKKMGVSQAYISKIESQIRVSPKVLTRVHKALKKTK